MTTILRRGKLALSLSLALAAGAAMQSSALFAQDAPPAGADTQAQASQTINLQAVQVTGTRIKGADMATQVPVLTITSDTLQKTGLTSVGDILQQVTSAGAALNTKFSSPGNFGSKADGSGAGAGSAAMDLRNLGSGRILVLVDGLRWVNETSGTGMSGSVDLNTIPASIIDRIDILQDGASSLYGSDAISGVVNIITKRAQNGASASTYFGTYPSIDGQATQSDLSFGKSGDRYQFFVDLSYVTQNQIEGADWHRTRNECVAGTGMANCSSTQPWGRYNFTDPSGVKHDLAINQNYTGNVAQYPQDFHKFGTADRYNYGPVNALLTPNDRYALFTSLRYDLAPSVTWYVRGLYNNRRSMTDAAPNSFSYGASSTNPFSLASVISKDNPYNPFGFDLDPQKNLTSISKRILEAGKRVYHQAVDTVQLDTGLQGQFGWGERDFSWDVNFVRGSNRASQTSTGNFNTLHVKNALGSAASCAAIPGCVPLNLFGPPGAITEDMLNYLKYVSVDRSQNQLTDWTANLSTDNLFNLPAGPLGAAAGVEHRHLSAAYTPDAIGLATGGIALPASGEYSVKEAYLELNAPLLANLPGVKSLNLSAATRYSDYSTFGSTTNSKFGLRWQVYDDLVLRGTWAEGFRAPSIGEAFGALSAFNPTLQDPCSAQFLTSPQIAANCRALGVPDGYSQNNIQIGTRSGGNRNLKPETSTSLTLGAVYSPGWAQNLAWSQRLDFTLNYYHILLNNAIQPPDAKTVLGDCVNSGNPNNANCQAVLRSRTGDIQYINVTLRNLGRIDTSGFDFSIDWRSPETSIGSFNANWTNTYVKSFNAYDQNNVQQPQRVGAELNDSSIPWLVSNLQLGWARKAWSVTTILRYKGPVKEDCGPAKAFPICNDKTPVPYRPNGTHYLGTFITQDLRASWKVPTKLDLTLVAGINNIWDRQPPVCVSCSLNSYDAHTYPLPDRYGYVQAKVNF
ncbi:MAG: TonB-dependent receptor [Xanthomonadales bacterium]|nr:TonB-dependent receptor [Xanthomonadales bacterium]